MQAGKLDQRITIQGTSEVSRNALNEPTTAPTTIGTFWASVEFLQGKELENFQQRWADARYKIRMRRQPGVEIKREQSIIWRDLMLDIVDVQGPGTRMNEWMIIAQDYVA